MKYLDKTCDRIVDEWNDIISNSNATKRKWRCSGCTKELLVHTYNTLIHQRDQLHRLNEENDAAISKLVVAQSRVEELTEERQRLYAMLHDLQDRMGDSYLQLKLVGDKLGADQLDKFRSDVNYIGRMLK